MSMREELQQLMSDAKEGLTADTVVEKAKSSKRYPALHEHLWGPSEKDLAHEARLARAHRLIISIKVTMTEGQTTRLYLHTSNVPGYQTLEKVTNTPNLAAIKLAELRADIGRARGRLNTFRSLLPDDVAVDIDAALALAEERAGKLATAVA